MEGTDDGDAWPDQVGTGTAQRAELKRAVNTVLGSGLMEEKAYGR